MCRSLKKHLPESRLWILCFDDTAYDVMAKLDLQNIKLIHYTDFEDDDLLKAKSNRSLVEYYWTCTPALPLYLLNKFPEMQHITYLDADLYFFHDPSSAFQEFGETSIFLQNTVMHGILQETYIEMDVIMCNFLFFETT